MPGRIASRRPAAQIELFYDRGNFYDFTCILRELDTPGVLSSVTQSASAAS